MNLRTITLTASSTVLARPPLSTRLGYDSKKASDIIAEFKTYSILNLILARSPKMTTQLPHIADISNLVHG